MISCKLCNKKDIPVSQSLGVCVHCIRQRPDKAMPEVVKAHRQARRAFGLPEEPPGAEDGLLCGLCVNECRIPREGIGFCGVRQNRDGRLTGVSLRYGKLSWYHDPLPTNCVADWVCPGGTGAGYPEFALKQGPEVGYKNLAVFFHSCTFDCLYCQNWHFREETLKTGFRTVEELVDAIDDRTTCICYFGGDPSSQMPFALEASRLALARTHHRPLRICWETNGTMNRTLLDKMVELSLQTGGVIKFDLKAWDENLHIALTGVTNRTTLENFAHVASKFHLRKSVPLLVASTLLVPGYVEEEQVRAIARFIGSLNREIPYSLLAFYPHFYMTDLPLVKKDLAERCRRVALEEGLKHVRIGNIHLLRD